MQLQKAKYWIILMFASLLTACSSSGPENVAEKYVNSLMTGDVDGAVKMLHLSKEEQAEINEVKGKLSMVIELGLLEVEASGGVKSIKALNTEYSNGKQEAEVEVETKMGNGDTKTDTVNLRKIKGDWKVVM